MPHPSTPVDDVDPSPARGTRDLLASFLNGSVAMFLFASLLVLAVVGLVAGLFMLLLWSLMPG